jgi:L-aspartate oxidase
MRSTRAPARSNAFRRATVLATGGAGAPILFSTAPRATATASPWPGGPVPRVEHGIHAIPPDLPYNLDVKNFLITEAVRGEGGHLKLPTTGERFGPVSTARGTGAARHRARAIDEIKRLGLDYVHLDISHKDPESSGATSPSTSAARARDHQEPIPVVPAQHYTCGGVLVDLAGRTDSAGLCGRGMFWKAACTGPIAWLRTVCSNALCSGIWRRAISLRAGTNSRRRCPAPVGREPGDRFRRGSRHRQNWTELRRFMWNYVGIVRTNKRLERAAHRIKLLKNEVNDYYGISA